MEKRRKVFDDGATVVEQVNVSQKKKPELKVNIERNTSVRNNTNKTVKVEDVISAFAGYLPTGANFMPKDGGACLLCGKETSSSMRKICIPCLQAHGKSIYNKAKEAIGNGEKEFSF